jgi:imidazolonepropionase-like amidohydrolase
MQSRAEFEDHAQGKATPSFSILQAWAPASEKTDGGGNCSDRRHSSPRLPVQACRLLDISFPYIMTARFTRLVPLALIATVPVLFAAQNSAPRETVLNHVSVIDMTGRPIQRDMAVLLRGDRIAAIERAAGFNVPGARVLDLTGKFLIPGLVDMHHHLDVGAAKPGPHLKQMLGWGFTTVFSTAHTNVDLREFAELRRASIDDAGLPRYFGVGRAISVASGHASQPRLGCYLPASPDEARVNVREMHAIGVDAIKLIYADQAHTGRPPVPMMQPEVMRAIIDEAHGLGLKAYVHAPALGQAKEALRAGADGLVHSVTDAPLDDEFITLMKKNGATYTTTLSLYTAFADVAAWMRRLAALDTSGRGPTDIYAKYQTPEGAKAYHAVVSMFPPDNLRHAKANVRRAVDAGIPVLAGTDTGMPGVLLGVSSQMELVLLVDAGLTTQQALAAATINPARAIGRGNEQGTIERGKLADLLVLDADPLADIHNIGKVHLVFKGGTPNN